MLLNYNLVTRSRGTNAIYKRILKTLTLSLLDWRVTNNPDIEPYLTTVMKDT